MTKEQKLGKCKKCMILSTTLAVASVALLVVSIGGLFFGSFVYSTIAALGVGFFGGLTSMHLVARYSSNKAIRAMRNRAMMEHAKSRETTSTDSQA